MPRLRQPNPIRIDREKSPRRVVQHPFISLSSEAGYTDIIVSINSILLQPSATTKSSSVISSSRLHQIRTSPTWSLYELGRISADECYDLLCLHSFPELTPKAIEAAITDAILRTRINYTALSALQELKSASNGRLRIIGVANTSEPEWGALRARRHWKIFWDVFDSMLTSWMVAAQMPDLAFFEALEKQLELAPGNAIFVDDKPENVMAAKARGMMGLQFDDTKEMVRILLNTVGDPVLRGYGYLQQNKGSMMSVTEAGRYVHDNLSQLLISHATSNYSLGFFEEPEGIHTWKFLMRGMKYPVAEPWDDVDTTALACLLLRPAPHVLESVMDKIRLTITSEGVVGSHFRESSPIADPVTCVNVLRLFYAHDRGAQLEKTLEYVLKAFWNRAYIGGTPRYPHPEAFLYFLSDLVVTNIGNKDKHYELFRLIPNLKIRLREFIGFPKDALSLAMRVLAMDMLDLDSIIYISTLKHKQCADGGWEADAFCTYSDFRIPIGNRGVTTAFAVKALTTCFYKGHYAQVDDVDFLPIGGPDDAKILAELEEQMRDFDMYKRFAASGDARLADRFDAVEYQRGIQFEADLTRFIADWSQPWKRRLVVLRVRFLEVVTPLPGIFLHAARQLLQDVIDICVWICHYAVLHDWILFVLFGLALSIFWLDQSWYLPSSVCTVQLFAIFVVCQFRNPPQLGPLVCGAWYIVSAEPYLKLWKGCYGELDCIYRRIRDYIFGKVEAVGETIKNVGEKVVEMTPRKTKVRKEVDEAGYGRG